MERLWRDLDDNEKEIYIEKARLDKLRYIAERKVYHENHENDEYNEEGDDDDDDKMIIC